MDKFMGAMLGLADMRVMVENQWVPTAVWLKVVSARIIYAEAVPGGCRTGDTVR
jgi:hypothetical protein